MQLRKSCTINAIWTGMIPLELAIVFTPAIPAGVVLPGSIFSDWHGASIAYF